MKTILVEARKDPNAKPTMDALAAACNDAGYRVVRWRGPLSGRVPHGRRIPRCDLAVLFNGTHWKYNRALGKLRRMRAGILFVELGWYPQTETFQLDHQGINAAASWVGEPLESQGRTPLRVRPTGDLLLILQHDGDTQIAGMSPWFPGMHALVEHVCRYSSLPVRVRAHPRRQPDESVVDLVNRLPCTWDRAGSLSEALKTCRAVACVNSSGAVEALANRLPVLCYGNAVYRYPGAVYCLRNDGKSTSAATEALAEGRCHVFEERVDAVLSRIQAKQWTIQEIPHRLPAVLDAAWARAGKKCAGATVSLGT